LKILLFVTQGLCFGSLLSKGGAEHSEAEDCLTHTPPQSNHPSRLFSRATLFLKRAFVSQGLCFGSLLSKGGAEHSEAEDCLAHPPPQSNHPSRLFSRATLFLKRAFVNRLPPLERRCRAQRGGGLPCSYPSTEQSPVTAFRRDTLFLKRAFVSQKKLPRNPARQSCFSQLTVYILINSPHIFGMGLLWKIYFTTSV